MTMKISPGNGLAFRMGKASFAASGAGRTRLAASPLFMWGVFRRAPEFASLGRGNFAICTGSRCAKNVIRPEQIGVA